MSSSKRSFEQTVEHSPRTSARNNDVANELFPPAENEDSRRAKKSRQSTPSSPSKSRPLPPSEPSAPPANVSQLPPHPHGHHPAPSTPWPLGQSATAPNHHPEGMPHHRGAPPSTHGYHSGYGPYYAALHPSHQQNPDGHHTITPIPPPHAPNAPHRNGFGGGDYPAWGMPTQYPYPEHRIDFSNQYLYPERPTQASSSSQTPYGTAGNSYERFGPYHEPNPAAYNHNPYGYSSGTHQGQPPSNIGFSGGAVGHPSMSRSAQESSKVEAEDGPIKGV